MVKTYGLTHLALAVRDVERSLRFYQQVFGVEAYFREEGRIHVKTPGAAMTSSRSTNMSRRPAPVAASSTSGSGYAPRATSTKWYARRNELAAGC